MPDCSSPALSSRSESSAEPHPGSFLSCELRQVGPAQGSPFQLGIFCVRDTSLNKCNYFKSLWCLPCLSCIGMGEAGLALGAQSSCVCWDVTPTARQGSLECRNTPGPSWRYWSSSCNLGAVSTPSAATVVILVAFSHRGEKMGWEPQPLGWSHSLILCPWMAGLWQSPCT